MLLITKAALVLIASILYLLSIQTDGYLYVCVISIIILISELYVGYT